MFFQRCRFTMRKWWIIPAHVRLAREYVTIRWHWCTRQLITASLKLTLSHKYHPRHLCHRNGTSPVQPESPEAVDNLIVRKPELKSEGGPKCKKRTIDGVKSNLYNPIQNCPVSEFIREFLARANADYKETQFATLFSEGELEYVECNYGTVPKGCVVSYQQPTIEENSKFLCIITGIPYLSAVARVI